MKKILFPTDFSETAINAFRYAVHLAEKLDAKIDVMSVYHLPISDAGRVPPDYIERMLREKQEQVEEHIRSFTNEAPPERLGTFRTDYGLFIAQEVVDAAQRNGYDLIVMGTKGEHNQLEKMLGSVTTRTMMQATCPVLAVPMGAHYQEIKNIAYATDFKPTDEHAVDQLLDFANLLSAAIHFVHINVHGHPGDLEDQIELKEYPFKFTDFAVISNPSPLEGLDSYIKQKHIDLLALFIPQRRLWERLFHSSLTKRMTFHSKIPLLVFRG